MFHCKTGSLVTLSNGNRTACRNMPSQEFNNGLVMSYEPLCDNYLFEVRIDKKIDSWSGSIEIGVTTCDPSVIDFPSSATELREATWLMSGTSVLRDGRAIIEEYGYDLDKLMEGDRVGVTRTAQGDVHFFVNGVNQGVAAVNIPSPVYAVIDMYGKCAQITVVENSNEARLVANEISNESTSAANINNMASNQVAMVLPGDRIRFHERCGVLVRLNNNNLTAERKRPLDEFNNGVVMTHRPLKDNEMFEIRIDRLVDKWSGSIEVGITTHNPATLEFPPTMTNMRTDVAGTVMMSGCGILTNGKGTRREYGQYNLDELSEGDKIGLMKKTNGNLHYYINGMDQGVAATKVPVLVWGVVDLYGMTVKVSIVEAAITEDPVTRNQASLPADKPPLALPYEHNQLAELSPTGDSEKLLFHSVCGRHAEVVSNGRAAHRPNALVDFNHAVVLTNRPLRSNERFEVQLDKLVSKWAGSVEIGVTTYIPTELELPPTMTNLKSGTWMMTGGGVMHNGSTIVDDYGQNLDRLKVGDRVGVLRKETGTLHFYVNGVDQGPAAANVPDKIYGVIDLYGQAAQASIIHQPDSCQSSVVAASTDLKFHHMCGRNAQITNNGFTATRPIAQGEFNDSIVISNRPLRDNEMFEIIIEKMVDRWSGSIEAGVTVIKPEELEFPNTMTDIDYGTWMLSGSAIMQDGLTVRNGYKLDLDTLGIGQRIGMMRLSDGSLHYYVNSEDQGVAYTDIPPNVYAVIDLYGQCSQVAIVQPNTCLPYHDNSFSSSQITEVHRTALPLGSQAMHTFSHCFGKNLIIKAGCGSAQRIRGPDHGLLFSSAQLERGEIFEVRVQSLCELWTGSLQIGITTAVNLDLSVSGLPSAHGGELDGETWLLANSQIYRNKTVVRDSYSPSLRRVQVGDHVGVKVSGDGSLHFYVNNIDLGIAASNIPKQVYAVVNVLGAVEAVSIISMCTATSPTSEASHSRRFSVSSGNSKDSLEHSEGQNKEYVISEFHGNHGRNIQLMNKNLTARRTCGYNKGIVFCKKPLPKGALFQVRLDKLNARWTSSLMIGVTAQPLTKQNLPLTALGLRRNSWLIAGDSVFQNGTKIKSRYGPNLDSLHTRHFVGIMADSESSLHLYINGVDQGVAAHNLPHLVYPFIDLYGQCEEVTIVGAGEALVTSRVPDHKEKANIDNAGQKARLSRSVISDQNLVVRNCEYQNACLRFRTALGLPDVYFNSEVQCFCESCYKIRGDQAYNRKGDPPREYGIPRGWSRFPIRLPPKIENSGLLDKWHMAYHGTTPGTVRRILDHGEILLPDYSGTLSGTPGVYHNHGSKDSESDRGQIYFSPTICYAGSSTFAPPTMFADTKSKQMQKAQVALQVLVRPGSYQSGPQRLNAREPIDCHFSNADLEWSCKETGAIILYGLLIRIDYNDTKISTSLRN